MRAVVIFIIAAMIFIIAPGASHLELQPWAAASPGPREGGCLSRAVWGQQRFCDVGWSVNEGVRLNQGQNGGQ